MLQLKNCTVELVRAAVAPVDDTAAAAATSTTPHVAVPMPRRHHHRHDSTAPLHSNHDSDADDHDPSAAKEHPAPDSALLSAASMQPHHHGFVGRLLRLPLRVTAAGCWRVLGRTANVLGGSCARVVRRSWGRRRLTPELEANRQAWAACFPSSDPQQPSCTITIQRGGVDIEAHLATPGATASVSFAMSNVLNVEHDDAAGVVAVTMVQRHDPGVTDNEGVSVVARLIISGGGGSAAMAELNQVLFAAAFPGGRLHLHALVSPTSGDGTGPKRWREVALPLLQLTPHRVTTTVTTHRGHAEEYAAGNAAVDGGDAVLVAVGGDGMAHEVINGLLARKQRADIRVGVFPAGSGCAVCMEFGVFARLDAVLALAHGQERSCDLFRCAVRDAANDSKVLADRTGFLSATFSSTAAVDLESEPLRWMGDARFLVDVLRRCAGLGKIFYDAKVRYKCATVDQTNPSCRIANPMSDAAKAAKDTGATRLDGVAAIARHFRNSKMDGSSIVLDARHFIPSPVHEPVPVDEGEPADGWCTVPHTSFGLLFAMNLRFMAADWMGSPLANCDDGVIDFVYTTQDLTRPGWIALVPPMMLGTVAGHAGVRICKCKEVEITPTNGYFSLDGEKMPIGKTTLSVLPRSQGIRMIWAAAPVKSTAA